MLLAFLRVVWTAWLRRVGQAFRVAGDSHGQTCRLYLPTFMNAASRFDVPEERVLPRR